MSILLPLSFCVYVFLVILILCLKPLPESVGARHALLSVLVEVYEVSFYFSVLAAQLKALEDILFGTESVEARLPLPDEIVTLVGEAAASEVGT